MPTRESPFLWFVSHAVITMAFIGWAATATAQGPPPFQHTNIPGVPEQTGSQRGSTQTGWQDDFQGKKLDRSRWIVMNGQAPGYIANNHIGYTVPNNVWMSNGYLVVLLTQQKGAVGTNPNGVISLGGGIYTRQTYGYGTYEWTMRMSSSASAPSAPGGPVSGSVSAGFIFVNDSQTEIDFEFSARTLDTIFMTNWNTINNSTSFWATLAGISNNFHRYKFVWSKDSISYYVDDVLQDVSRTNVPSAPAYFMINHWGTNDTGWGGLATVGVPRYFYIDRVSYSPSF